MSVSKNKRKRKGGHRPNNVSSAQTNIEDIARVAGDIATASEAGPLWGQLHKLFLRSSVDTTVVAAIIMHRDEAKLAKIIGQLQRGEETAVVEEEPEVVREEAATASLMAYGGTIPEFNMRTYASGGEIPIYAGNRKLGTVPEGMTVLGAGDPLVKEIKGKYESFAYGGDIDKAEFEIEGGETIQAKGMQVYGSGGGLNYLAEDSAIVQGNDHGPDSRNPNSGVKMAASDAEEGRIFSKRIKNPKTGKTFAKESAELLKKIGK